MKNLRSTVDQTTIQKITLIKLGLDEAMGGICRPHIQDMMHRKINDAFKAVHKHVQPEHNEAIIWKFHSVLLCEVQTWYIQPHAKIICCDHLMDEQVLAEVRLIEKNFDSDEWYGKLVEGYPMYISFNMVGAACHIQVKGLSLSPEELGVDVHACLRKNMKSRYDLL